ncbi:MAG: hypothetical protein II258_04150 [Spirochaetales bacterium]|nr:hypothetical protein [Spirochaetales bacterium]MBQ2294553.1 hypothetical protein [Spirochaetales bacterium]
MKKLFLLSFLFLSFFVFGQDVSIPRPKNELLYTEYTSRKSSPYIKKIIESTGWIAKDGENFAFFQETPSLLKVVNKGDEMSLKIGNNKPMKMKKSAAGNGEFNEVNILFTADTAELNRVFAINCEAAGEKMRYFLQPKSKDGAIGKIEYMRFVSIDDKLEKLEMKYKNGTVLEFKFFNTVTGEFIDEKKFD